MPSGLRVNCTEAASARNSRSRAIAALIASAASVPGKPMKASAAPPSAASAPAPRSSGGLCRISSPTASTSASPRSRSQVRPPRIAASRTLSAMSPFRMWLYSWPITPWSSSRESCSASPAVAMITASPGESPATSALTPCSRSSTYTGGTAMRDAIAISSTTFRSLRSAGVQVPGST